MIWFFRLVANVTFWVLLFFGREELDGWVWWALFISWPVIWAVFRLVPDGIFMDMAIVAILDIYMLNEVLGGDAARV
jgi:hypothetical protein